MNEKLPQNEREEEINSKIIDQKVESQEADNQWSNTETIKNLDAVKADVLSTDAEKTYETDETREIIDTKQQIVWLKKQITVPSVQPKTPVSYDNMSEEQIAELANKGRTTAAVKVETTVLQSSLVPAWLKKLTT